MKKVPATLSAMFGIPAASGAPASGAGTQEALLAGYLAILLPFAASGAIFLLYSRLEDSVAWLGALSGAGSFIALLAAGTGPRFGVSWISPLNVNAGFMLDGLSLMMGLLASGIGALVFMYAHAYMAHGDRKKKFYTVLTAFMGSMIGLVLSSNLISLFLFWELTSICSFLLISHSQRTMSGILASKKSLLVTVGSGLLLLAGIVMIGQAAGTYSIPELLGMELGSLLRAQGLLVPAVVSLVVGAGAKSAQVPFHIWLPDAMEAPTPVSAFLHSATMVKAGVFLLARFRPMLNGVELWTPVLAGLGLLTMVSMAVMAFRSTELKELLAYSTASHLGMITAALGLSNITGAETALFHILNHAVFKASLFMVAGAVLHKAGTQKISELGGIRHQSPVLAAAATVSGLSMAGVPPLNGFFSKELFFKASFGYAEASGGIAWIIPVMAVAGSVLTVLYSLRFVSAFHGDLTTELESMERTLIMPPVVLAGIAAAVGLVPELATGLLSEALKTLAGSAHGFSVHLPHSLKPAVVMSAATFSLGALGWMKRGDSPERLNSYISSIPGPDRFYRSGLELLDELSDEVSSRVETGLLRTYIVWILAVSISSTVGGFILSGLPGISLTYRLPLVTVFFTSLLSVYAVIRSDTYIGSVMTLSILGFMVSIFYLLMDAPDLVLTQLVVETLTLIIFLLVLDRLPEFSGFDGHRSRDILLSSAAGLTVFIGSLMATAKEKPAELASYYLENAVPGSGGGNVVNVILVDFRGFDTLVETSVIFMAGLAVVMLFRMRGDKDE